MGIEPFRLERYFARYEFAVKHMLSCSDAESMSLDELLSFDPDLRDSLGSTRLGYSESTGLPELREAIAQTYESMEPTDVLTHVGAEEPIFNLMQSCLDPGDAVIVHVPCYQSFLSIPRSMGCEVIPWEARVESSWRLDLDELTHLITPRTRLIVVNSPHNPTGYVMSEAEQRELIHIARERGIWLLSDEVYRGIELDGTPRLPAACDRYERAVSLGVLSKAYGLAGLRVGWIATRDREIYARLERFKDYTTICSPVISEKLATVAVRNRDAIIGRNRAIVEKNVALVESFMRSHADRWEWVRPRGGTVAFPRAREGRNMERFGDELLKSSGVLLVGGSYFGSGPEYLRLGLGRASFAEAFELFQQFDRI